MSEKSWKNSHVPDAKAIANAIGESAVTMSDVAKSSTRHILSRGIYVPPKAVDERKVRYYLGIAKAVAENSTCLRRRYGAVIVKNDEIIATGYNGAPRKCLNCSDTGFCMRNVVGATKGSSYDICMSVHAEMNAMLSAARRDMLGSTLYIVGLEVESHRYAKPEPCLLCHRQIINAGIVDCYGFDNGEIVDDAPYSRIDISGVNFMRQMRDNIQQVAMELPEDTALEVVQKLTEAGLYDDGEEPPFPVAPCSFDIPGPGPN